MRYGGTVDLLAMIDGKLALVDYKTTYRVMEKSCGVQLEAYAQALASHGIEVQEMPTPPAAMVGIKSGQSLEDFKKAVKEIS